jgi:class 3 adenylate cyclase/tetratricopeptide (TPR) repeat protein
MGVMICPRCQRENSPSSTFCDQCGARLETACPNCGESNRRDAKFCRNCGQQVTDIHPAIASAAPAAPAPDNYVPKHLAEKILASRHTLEGERKQVTVLFADIRGSTKLVEGIDPEEAQKIIDPVLRVMMDAVHRYEGTVNQVLGDGIMALFGAPLAHEDHALRACYAALAMQEQMRRHRKNLGQSEESGLHIGIGMNSGEVVVRSIDNDLNIDYSALGHTTHLAARMQELAGPGVALMSSSTLRQVEGFVHIQSLGPVQAKGVSQPVEAYSLIGATTARTRVQAGAARGLTPLVGRSTEIDIFNKLVQRASAGRGQILAMIGEPGVGKSRLVHEFTRHQLPPGWLVLEGASVSYGKATPYFPLIEMLRRYFQIGAGEGSENIRNQVVTHILELDSTLKDTIPPILSLLGALPDEKTTQLDQERDWLARLQDIGEMITRFNSMDPQQRRRYTLDALKRICILESQRQNLLLVFEDLHWIDHETQAFLDVLVDSLPMARLLLLVNYRPGYSHEWSEKSYYTQLRVDPLQTSSAEELLSNLLGNNPDFSPLKQLLIKRTEGNPFFAEESVTALVETGVLTGEKGAYRPGLKIDDLVIPSTVQSVVADRIDRLPAEEKHLLQTAAVIGVIVPFDLLQAVSELPDDQLFQYLAHLKSAEFIYETNLFPKLEYTFKHALTNEVAYGALLRERRNYLHSKIVTVLENSAVENLRDHVETLAHHAFHGEIWDKAVFYLKEAGAKSVSRSSFRNAVLWYEQALRALRNLPVGPNALRDSVDLRVNIRNALFVLGDFQQGIKYLEEAKEAAVVLKDHARLGTILNLMTAHWNIAGNSEQAILSAKEALVHTKAPENIDSHIVAHYFLGVAHHNLGQYEEAVEVLGRGLPLIGDRKFELFGTTGSVYVICRVWLIRALAQLGRFSDAAPYVGEAIHTAEESQHPYSIAYAYYGAGILFLIKGDFDKSIELLERGLAVCDTAEIPVQRPLVASCLGAAYAFVGRLDEAHHLLESAVAHTASMRRLAGQAMRVAWLSSAYLFAGRADEAETLARRGLELAAESKDKGSHAWLMGVLADVTVRRRPLNVEKAEADYGMALALAQELGMRPLRAHCHMGIGNLHAQVQNAARARSELHAAIDIYKAISMPYWLSKAEDALSKLKT